MSEPASELPQEIDVATLSQWRRDGTPHSLLDVRTHFEFSLARLTGSTLIPIQELEDRLDEALELAQPVVVLCHHGVRSFSASEFLRSQGVRATSVRGGIEAWSVEIDTTVPRY